MFESLRRSIGLRIAEFRFRRTRDSIISFSSAVTNARRALIILPLDGRELLSTMMIIDLINHKFRQEDITVIADEHGLEAMRLLPRSHFLRILETEIDPLFIPRTGFLQQVMRRKYDIAIDLNLDLVLPSGYICKESNAPIRIGFSRKQADTFYNFQIQPDPTLSRKLIYDRLAKCLEMF